MNRKWLLRLGLTALALFITTDRRRRPAPAPPKPTEDKLEAP